MESQNICRFIPDDSENEKLHIINLVLETKVQKFSSLKNPSVQQMYYVKNGEGILHTSGGKQVLKKGDVFFTFPASPFAIESVKSFEYMYASYLGTRANKIYESLGINRHNCIFSGYFELERVWSDAIKARKEASALRVESTVLYTLSLIAENILPNAPKNSSGDAVLLVKKYVDDNLSDSELSLDRISSELSYNAKYLSSLFKKKMGIGVSEYITTVRIQHACTLMEQGITGIKDIATMCGFKDALYFSKVFKKKMATSPKEHIANFGK